MEVAMALVIYGLCFWVQNTCRVHEYLLAHLSFE